MNSDMGILFCAMDQGGFSIRLCPTPTHLLTSPLGKVMQIGRLYQESGSISIYLFLLKQKEIFRKSPYHIYS